MPTEYADIRIGKVPESAYKLLTERLITPGRRATVAEIYDCYSCLGDNKGSPLILLPRNSLCDEVNGAILQKTGNPYISSCRPRGDTSLISSLLGRTAGIRCSQCSVYKTLRGFLCFCWNVVRPLPHRSRSRAPNRLVIRV